MKLIKSTILSLSLLAIAPALAEEEVFELNVGENSGSSIFGIDFDPVVHLNLTGLLESCLLYTSPSPRDQRGSRMPSSA